MPIKLTIAQIDNYSLIELLRGYNETTHPPTANLAIHHPHGHAVWQ